MRERRERYRTRLHRVVAVLVVLVLAFFVLCTVQDRYGIEVGIPNIPVPSFTWLEDILKPPADAPASSGDSLVDAKLRVHFLDVGQGEAILVQTATTTVLIDAGENGQETKLLGYLRAQGVKKIDILIATHPHSDHIGAMDTVVKEMEIGRVIMPNLPDAIIPTSRCFTDLLQEIAAKDMRITAADVGDVYDLGEGTVLTILAPGSAVFDNLNDYSIVCRIQSGETSFLFTGDLEQVGEAALLQGEQSVAADVLSVGHHGSKTSSGEAFVQAVAPSFAVISCGIDNSYGHPHRDAIKQIKAQGATVYRTDLSGTIVIESDGKDISVRTES